MWIGKCFPRLLASVLLVSAMASCASGASLEVEHGSQPAVAWWYDFELEPRDGNVRGIPVDELDPDWIAASILDEGVLAQSVSRESLATYQSSGLRFAVTGDLDSDGIAEDAFVGTFEARDGSRGRFLAVAHEGRLVRHFLQAGDAGFSALLPVDGGVRWYTCLQCGEYELLRWSGGSYVLE